MYEIYAKLRDEMGVKDATVAKSTGIGKSTFTDWRTGRSAPKDEKLKKIADFFGVSMYYLRTGKEPIQIEIDTKPHREMFKRRMENLAPGLSSVYYAYILFDDDDRNEVLALINAKLEKYELDAKKDGEGSA